MYPVVLSQKRLEKPLSDRIPCSTTAHDARTMDSARPSSWRDASTHWTYVLLDGTATDPNRSVLATKEIKYYKILLDHALELPTRYATEAIYW